MSINWLPSFFRCQKRHGIFLLRLFIPLRCWLMFSLPSFLLPWKVWCQSALCVFLRAFGSSSLSFLYIQSSLDSHLSFPPSSDREINGRCLHFSFSLSHTSSLQIVSEGINWKKGKEWLDKLPACFFHWWKMEIGMSIRMALTDLLQYIALR